MISLIRAHLIDRLAPFFGAPKNAEMLAAELARHLPAEIASGDLDALAERLIAGRRQKTFPAASELIAAVKAMPVGGKPQARPQTEVDAWYEADRFACRYLASTKIADRAVREQWAPVLIEFVREHKREPNRDEEAVLVRKSRDNDALAKQSGRQFIDMRKAMHSKAARKLGYGPVAETEIVMPGLKAMIG